MSRRRSICFLCAMVAIVLLAVVTYVLNDKPSQENETQMDNKELTQSVTMPEVDVETMQEKEAYRFVVRIEEQQLAVYDDMSGEFLFCSGISCEDLPLEVQQEAENGLFFTNEDELYDFLENYSS